MIECVERKTLKYMERNSPPYKAGDCQGMKKKGNDGTMYESVPHGKYYRWVKVKNSSSSKNINKVKNSSSSSSIENIKNILRNESYDSLIDIQKFLQELLKKKYISLKDKASKESEIPHIPLRLADYYPMK
jgi:hypothetical protein